MPILRIVRGLPGSGKSTKAKSFGCFHVEADMFHIKDDEYKWSGSQVMRSHEWCRSMVKQAMASGMDVVISNTFTRIWEFQDYIDLASHYGYKVVVIRCTNEFGNIHNVPDHSLKQMKDRFEDYEGELVYEVNV